MWDGMIKKGLITKKNSLLIDFSISSLIEQIRFLYYSNILNIIFLLYRYIFKNKKVVFCLKKIIRNIIMSIIIFF